MIQVFKCPSCGASLSYEGGDESTVKCQFCGSTVVVPEELRAKPAAAPPASPAEASPAAALAEIPLGKLAQLKALTQTGRKVEAIRLYREVFPQAGLAEAKEAVEKLGAGQPLVFTHTTTRIDTSTAGDLGQAASLAAVVQLVRAGKKIEAIRLYREIFGGDLETAKGAVEAMDVGQPVVTTRFTVATSNAEEAGDSRLAQVIELARSGKKIEAIKLYREMHGTGLKDAKDAVEAIEAGQSAQASIDAITNTAVKTGRGAQTVGCVAAIIGVVLALFGAGLALYVAQVPAHVSNSFAPSAPAPTATLSLAGIDATSGAISRATAVVQATLDAETTGTAEAVAAARAETTAQAAATAEAQTTAQAMIGTQAAWPPVVVETFKDNHLGWPLGVQQDKFIAVNTVIKEGKYLWTVTPKQGNSYLNFVPKAGEPLTDFHASVDVRFIRGGEGGNYAYGLVFRHVDNDYGFFGIQSDGVFRLLVVYDTGIYQHIIQSASAIRRGQTNRIAVRASGSDFVFEINDQIVWQLAEDFAPGQIGLGVDVISAQGEAQVEFANLEVRAP